VESLKLRGRDSEALFLLGRTYEKQGHSGGRTQAPVSGGQAF